MVLNKPIFQYTAEADFGRYRFFLTDIISLKVI